MRDNTRGTLRLSRKATPLYGGGGGRGRGAGCPASEKVKAEGGRVGGAAGRSEPEGRDLRRHYRSVSLKTLPTAPPTNPYKCHKSRQQYIFYLDTSNSLDKCP